MEQSLLIKLYPNKQQKELIEQTFGNTRYVYNYFLKYAKDNGVYNFYDWCKLLTKIKQENEWLNISDKFSLQNSLKDLKIAFKKYFAQYNLYPKFHKKGEKESYRTNFTNNNITLLKNKIKLPKLGYIKCRYKIDFEIDKIVNVTIKKVSNMYYASIAYNREFKYMTANKSDVGLDLGVRKLITTSDGKKYYNINNFVKMDMKIRRMHRSLCKKKIGSNNRTKCKYLLNKLYRKRTNTVHDVIQKATTEIVRTYNRLFLETIDISQLKKNQKKRMIRNKMQCSCFGYIKYLLIYKCKKYDRQIFFIDRFYPSSKVCSNCGSKYDIDDTEIYRCPHCGKIMDRDVNAAINILNKGLIESAL